MDFALKLYLAGWLFALGVAIVLLWRDPAACPLTSAGYRAFLRVPWKLTSFVIAAAGMAVIAPYTGDPTWDYFDALMMSVLTYLTAPWAVGTLYRGLRRQESLRNVYIAACCWMLSASWCYDLYLLLRDGDYPITWLPNIPLSSVLYCSAGLMWSLEWRTGRGLTFAFLEADWPSPPVDQGFRRVFWAALPFMVLAATATLVFVFEFFGWVNLT